MDRSRSPLSAFRGAALAACVAVPSLSPGCRGGCGREAPAGADPARAALDVASVHLYLAAKAAVVAEQPSEDAARVRALVTHAASSPTRAASEALSLKTAGALWRLRGDGKKVLDGNPDVDLPPLLPALAAAAPGLPAARLEILDAPTEHALLLTAMFALAHQPVAPAPLPSGWVLYEAWMTRPEQAKVGHLRGALHGMRAAAFGASGLCDLAAGSGRAAASADVSGANEQAALFLSLSPEQARLLSAGTRALGHAASAECFARKANLPAARREAEALVEAAGAMGLPEAELAALRKAAERLAEGGGAESAGALAASASGFVSGRLEATGLARALREAAPVEAVERFASSVGRVCAELRGKVPGAEELGLPP